MNTFSFIERERKKKEKTGLANTVDNQEMIFSIKLYLPQLWLHMCTCSHAHRASTDMQKHTYATHVCQTHMRNGKGKRMV